MYYQNQRTAKLIDSQQHGPQAELLLVEGDSAARSAASMRNPQFQGVLPLQGKPLSDLQPFWQRVRARAGVKDVRIHDLRHTFASTAVASGQSLPMIGKLLGHTQVQTTARYAHLAAEPVRMAADAVAQNLRQSLG